MNASSSSPTRPTALALIVTLLVSAAVGCSSASEQGEVTPPNQGGSAAAEPATEGEVASTESEIRASCSNPRKYFVTFRDGSGTCEPIPATNGRWVPEQLFADAPGDVQTTTCAYRWSGVKYSRPDRQAIAARVGNANALASACGASTDPEVGLLRPIPVVDILSHVGAAGCDVCGVLRSGTIWVILPPERVATKQFNVRLDDGQLLGFQIESTDARALTVTLPPAPPGTKYVSGRVQIF